MNLSTAVVTKIDLIIAIFYIL
jgi:hypothetical protein